MQSNRATLWRYCAHYQTTGHIILVQLSAGNPVPRLTKHGYARLQVLRTKDDFAQNWNVREELSSILRERIMRGKQRAEKS